MPSNMQYWLNRENVRDILASLDTPEAARVSDTRAVEHRTETRIAVGRKVAPSGPTELTLGSMEPATTRPDFSSTER